MAQYLVAENWEHIFSSGPGNVRFVYDVESKKLTHMQVRYNNQWNDTDRTAIEDVEDSLVNANSEALDPKNSESWGLDESSELPEWAKPSCKAKARKKDELFGLDVFIDSLRKNPQEALKWSEQVFKAAARANIEKTLAEVPPKMRWFALLDLLTMESAVLPSLVGQHEVMSKHRVAILAVMLREHSGFSEARKKDNALWEKLSAGSTNTVKGK